MRLSRGIVDAEMPKLFLDPVKIEETLGSDTVYKRELYLASENNLYIKGLAYSSHSRVKILKSAFGGLRNHIVYEVDTSWCENGDLIKGNFTLVTNSGELEVPFLFRVEMIESVRVLSTLKTMEDFVELFRNHPAVDAGLAASIFHTKQVEIGALKQYLRSNGIEMRV